LQTGPASGGERSGAASADARPTRRRAPHLEKSA
jgi:hypothetical protein